MDAQKSREDLVNFLRNNNTAVIATVRSGDKVHAAMIYYYVEDDLRFYFLTKHKTEKFMNIQENHSIALVISDPGTLQTVQVEGDAKEVDYGKDYAETVEKLSLQLSRSGKGWEMLPLNHVQNSGYYVFVQVTPNWIRWSDYKNWAHTVMFEQRFSEISQATH